MEKYYLNLPCMIDFNFPLLMGWQKNLKHMLGCCKWLIANLVEKIPLRILN